MMICAEAGEASARRRTPMGANRLRLNPKCMKPPALPQDSQSSTVAGLVRVALLNGTTIPLTLTFSLGERESRFRFGTGWFVREGRRADTALGFAARRRWFLPLPMGEYVFSVGSARASPDVFGGVGPSSGAETQEEPVAFGQSDPLERADVAAAEDGRTPLNTYMREGWGEGNDDNRWANRVGTSPEVRSSPEGPYGFEPFIISCLRLCRSWLTCAGVITRFR
jgi:hypothetical protein